MTIYVTASNTICVGYHTGHGIQGAELRVHEVGSEQKELPGNGMLFESVEQAQTFAFEKGYLRIWRDE